ncbi:hypothetical protein [Capybara microvirus Cap3_SP_437]|nr:hypothetical protein [Capybara microvirus Cap3_SP_437]
MANYHYSDNCGNLFMIIHREKLQHLLNYLITKEIYYIVTPGHSQNYYSVVAYTNNCQQFVRFLIYKYYCELCV